MSGPERWHSLEEMAEHLGVSQDTIHRWIRTKNMPANKAGRLWKFDVAQVNDWVRSGEAGDAHSHGVSHETGIKPGRQAHS